MLLEFQNEWFAEVSRWVDATIKIAVDESDHNRERVALWTRAWIARCSEALLPLAVEVVGAERAGATMAELCAGLIARLEKKSGLAL